MRTIVILSMVRFSRAQPGTFWRALKSAMEHQRYQTVALDVHPKTTWWNNGESNGGIIGRGGEGIGGELAGIARKGLA